MARCSLCTWHVVACLILASAPALRAQEMIGSWTVEYQTRALRVEAVDEGLPEGNRRLVTVKLTNLSGRPVTAIALDVENAKSTTLMNGNTIKPSASFNFKVRNDVNAEPYRRIRINAVLFADKGPDAGDRDAAEAMRFDQLGGFIERNRCLGILNQLDAATLTEPSLAELVAALEKGPKTLDEALASLPVDPQFDFVSHERIKRASEGARQAFVSGIRFQRFVFQNAVRTRLMPLVAETLDGRALRLRILRGEYRRDIDALRPICERDMESDQ